MHKTWRSELNKACQLAVWISGSKWANIDLDDLIYENNASSKLNML